MKYVIETTENGCKETLSFTDKVFGEVVLERNHLLTGTPGCEASECGDKTFAKAMEELGICEELVEEVNDCIDSFFPHEFMILARDMSE